ncbi:MAG: butyrate kinase, partial [Rikenellaceae bacterium]|nr:butyrate kinase [Rikenellaceae bacterium]
MKTPLILAVNPGSTSTKIAVTRGLEPVFEKNIQHPASELRRFAAINDQFGFRRDLVASSLKEAGIKLSDIDIFMGRGGLVRPIESGVWEVNDAMV